MRSVRYRATRPVLGSLSTWRLGAALMMALAGSLLFAAAGQAQIKANLGTLCSNPASNLASSGNCNPRGIAVNYAGTGGASPGDVYVLSGPITYNRVEQFRADGSFVRAFGLNVGGPGVNVCTIACVAGTSSAAAGALNAGAGISIDQETGNVYISGNANRRLDVFSATGAFQGAFGIGVVTGQTAADGLTFCTTATGCQAGTNSATAGAVPGAAFNGVPAAYPTVAPAGSPFAGDVFVADPVNARVDQFRPTVSSAGVVTGVTFVHAFGWNVAPGAVSEEQMFNVDAGAGQFRLTFGGDTTPDLARNASATDVATALNALPSISAGGGSVTVAGGTGAPGGGAPYVVAFDGGPLAGTDVQELVVSIGTVPLSGGSPTGAAIVTATQGAAASTGLENCTTRSGCQVGASGTGDGQFSTQTPGSLAIDEAGSIYVVDRPLTCSATAICRVQKFNSRGTTGAEFGFRVTSGNNQTGFAVHTVAIDPATQNVVVSQLTGPGAAQIKELTSSGELVPDTTSPTGGVATSGGIGGLAIGPDDRVYVTRSGPVPAQVVVLGPVPPPDTEIDPVTDVTTTTATFHGSVTIPAPGFPATYRFEYSTDGVTWTRLPNPDVSVGGGVAGTYSVQEEVEELQPSTSYAVRLVATTGPSTTSSTIAFQTEGAAPAVSQVYAEARHDRAVLSALINPNKQATTYYFEWGPTAAYGNRTPDYERPIGSGRDYLAVREQIAGLTPATTYHYRLVTENATGTTASLDRTLTTLAQADAYTDRVAELVSPARKSSGAYVGIYRPGAASTYMNAAIDGQSVFYPVAFGLPDSTAFGQVQYKAVRGDGGWQSSQMTPPKTVVSEPDSSEEFTGRYQYLPPDLSCGVLTTAEPLTPDAPIVRDDNGQNLFARLDDGTYRLLSPERPSNLGPDLVSSLANDPAHGYTVAGASEDCRHVVFSSLLRFQGLNQSGLYRSDDGVLSDIGILPDGSPVMAPSAGEAASRDGVIGSGKEQDIGITWRAVSSPDPSRVYFTETSNDGNDAGKLALYLREGSETTKVSASKVPSVVNQDAYYQVAAKDGSKVAFLANYGLTQESSVNGPQDATTCRQRPPQPCALYVYDVADGSLTDISADDNPSDTNGASAAGVIAADDDLSRVYFAAYGQLVPDEGRTYSANVNRQTANVYLWDDGDLRFVANVLRSDLVADDDKAPNMLMRNQSRWRSQTTPEGGSLLFASRADIVGYPAGNRAQAYLYSAATDEVVCLSCRRDGRPPVVGLASDDAVFPNARAALTGNFKRPLNLTDDGRRAFFQSRDALAPGATDGHVNLYEWHDGTVRLLVSSNAPGVYQAVFSGASSSGADVFVVTPEALDPRDVDGMLDLYDLRIGGRAGHAQETDDCDPLSEGCQGAGDDPVAPPIDSRGGDGNVPSGPRGTVAVDRLTKRQRAALARGRRVLATATVNAPGDIEIVGRSRVRGKSLTVFAASRATARGGKVELPLRLTFRARRALARAGALTVRVRATFSQARKAKVLQFRLVDSGSRSLSGRIPSNGKRR